MCATPRRVTHVACLTSFPCGPQADLPAIFVTSLTFWRSELLPPTTASPQSTAEGDRDGSREVSCLAIFSQWPFTQIFEHILHFLIRNLGTPAFRIDRFVQELTAVELPALYATGAGPAPSMTLSLRGDCLYVNRVLQPASAPCDLPILPPTFPCTTGLTELSNVERLLELLSPTTVVKCIGYLLNNFSIMLLSDDIRDLAVCSEALRALVFPFELPHVYIPYLPLILGDTCRAPVSFLMGMLLEDYVAVELDEAVSFATVYLGHDRFIPPMVCRASLLCLCLVLSTFSPLRWQQQLSPLK